MSKIKYQCAIYLGNYGINIYSNYPKTFEILRDGSFVPFIPEYRCIKKRSNSEYSIVYIESGLVSAKMLNNKTLEIKGPVNSLVLASAIPFRAHFMIEAQMEKDSIFTTQGAGASKNGKAVLLMGKRGAGKTSVTLELCKKYGYKLVGNDLLLAGFNKNKGYFYGGAKVFTLRYTTVKYYNTDLQKFFNKESPNEWTNKVRLLPADLDIPIEKDKPEIAKALYIHLLNDKSAPLYIRKIDDKEVSNMGTLYLYEELSRYIRGVCIPFVYGSQFKIGNYLPSLDNNSCHKNRVRFINWLVRDMGFYFVSGSMKAICDYINSGVA